MVARILSGLVGAVMLISAINWIIDPVAAAASLEIKESLSDVGGETLLGRNTLIGDFTSFFFTAGILSCIGSYRNEHEWLYGPLVLLGSAAIFRLTAGVMHGTEFWVPGIISEILFAIMLIVSINLMKKSNS
ncbi:hypothetical protein N8148_03130 [Gammaproteobacteria bacterium]|jgi:hypothetical protein|nr:hypothetical protein [Gammaproteobacteria bacterium]|tara:strand:+ start:112 stop:507 length:396 start_codon:yes stop_codon:yes gene_type:complete